MPNSIGEDSEGEEDRQEDRRMAEEETSDEEPELQNVRRPKKGAGWWGHGSPVRAHRKGVSKALVDGAGLPSPGRWGPKQRRLPDDDVAKDVRKILKDGLKASTDRLPGSSLKTALAALAAGKCEASPFPEEVVENVRMELRMALKKAGHGDGLPREGDVVQVTEVRLLQALLRALQDPDHFFCERWSRGVWLGSPERGLQ